MTVEYYGAIAKDATVNIANSNPHDMFIVAVGTWNWSCLYAVFPNNGNAPVVRLLASYSGTDMVANLVSISAYSSWGLSFTGGYSPSTRLTVFKLHKS